MATQVLSSPSAGKGVARMPVVHKPLVRREFLAAVAGTVLGLTGSRSHTADDQKLPPVRAITKGPKFHWFGYYDKLQFDPTSRYVLGMEVDFEHRSPKADDVIKVGMVDLQ